MQTWLKVTGIATAITVTTVLTSPLWLPIDTLWQQVADQIKQQTGRDIYVDGAKEFSLIPTLAIELEQVRVTNVVGGTARDMLTVQQLRLEMPWRFLWTRQFELEQFVLSEPVLHLEKNRKGEANWHFSRNESTSKPLDNTTAAATPTDSNAAAQAAAVATAQHVATVVEQQAAARGYDVKLGQFKIENGQISYQDAQAVSHWAVDVIDLSLQMPSLQSAAKAQGQLNYMGKPLQLAVEITSPAAIMADQPATISIDVSNPLVSASLIGQYQVDHPTSKENMPTFAGKWQSQGSSLRAVQGWLQGAELTSYDASTLGKFSIAGDVTATPVRIGINNMQALLDTMELSGNLTLKTGAKPVLLGELKTNLLNLTPYLSASTALPTATDAAANAAASQDVNAQEAASSNDAATSTTAAKAPADKAPADNTAVAPMAAGWSTQAFDLSVLSQLDADIKLQSAGVLLYDITLGETQWHVTNKQAKLKAQLKKFSAYEGAGQGSIDINAQQTPYKLQSNVSFTGINAQGLLHDALGVDQLLGKGNVSWQLSSKGNSQAELISNLQGQASTRLTDGAVRGANIAAMVKSVQEALAGNLQGVDFDKDFQKAEQTDFSEFSATFAVTNGVISNKDLSLQSPLLRLTGSGSIDLPQQRLDLLLQPKLVASIEGQGSKKAKKGLNIPVRIDGPWSNIKVRPDVSKAAKKKVKDKVKKKVTNKAKQLLKTGG